MDFTKRFTDAGIQNLKLHPQDQAHPNDAGHTMLAEALSKYVLSNKADDEPDTVMIGTATFIKMHSIRLTTG